jgi:hypothetical protein
MAHICKIGAVKPISFPILGRTQLASSTSSAFLSHVDLRPMAKLLSAVPRSTAQCDLDQWLVVLYVLLKTPPAPPEALKILEQFIQLKAVADRVHDSVLQH